MSNRSLRLIPLAAALLLTGACDKGGSGPPSKSPASGQDGTDDKASSGSDSPPPPVVAEPAAEDTAGQDEPPADPSDEPEDADTAVPSVARGQVDVAGSLDKEIIGRIVRAHINEVRYCYARELAKDPELGGIVRVKFQISASGDVASSKVTEDELDNDAVASCVAGAVKRWKFPKPEGNGAVVVTYPFKLAPG